MESNEPKDQARPTSAPPLTSSGPGSGSGDSSREKAGVIPSIHPVLTVTADQAKPVEGAQAQTQAGVPGRNVPLMSPASSIASDYSLLESSGAFEQSQLNVVGEGLSKVQLIEAWEGNPAQANNSIPERDASTQAAEPRSSDLSGGVASGRQQLKEIEPAGESIGEQGGARKEALKQASHILREELNKPRPLGEKVRTLCRERLEGLVPAEMRGEVWKVLLGVDKKNTSPLSNWDGSLDLPNQRVIKADCERTRQDMDLFRSEETKTKIEKLLTYYCKCRSVKYKQGLNELLAPFFTLDLDDGSIFNMFYALISKFLSKTFSDENFEGLQLYFRMFRLVVQYHDPELCNFLDEWDITPELYATSWFVTLFSHKLPMRLLYVLWDQFIVEGDPLLPLFVAVALMISKRQMFLSTAGPNLPETITKINIVSEMEVFYICKQGKALQLNTPKSFRRRLYTTFFQIGVKDEDAAVLEEMPCIPVTMQDVLTPDQHIRNFMIDTRTARRYGGGNLPTAFHIDPLLGIESGGIEKQVEYLQSLEGLHLWLMGNGGSDKDRFTPQIMLILLQKKFKHVGLLDGGFVSCHIYAESKKVELVDHEKSTCFVCNRELVEAEEAELSKLESEDWQQVEIADASNQQDPRRKSSGANILSKLMPSWRDERTDGSVGPGGEAPSDKNVVINLETWVQDKSMHFFTCSLLKPNGQLAPRTLIISPGYIICIQAHKNRSGYALLKTKYSISQLDKIVSRRSNAQLITFQFKPNGDEGVPVQHTYLVHKAKECVSLVRNKYLALAGSTTSATSSAGSSGATTSTLVKGVSSTKEEAPKGQTVIDVNAVPTGAEVDLEAWKSADHLRVFKAKRVRTSGEQSPRWLVVCPSHILSLDPCNDCCVVSSKYTIRQVDKISSRKSDPTIVVFQFKISDTHTVSHTYSIEGARECVDLVKQNFRDMLRAAATVAKSTSNENTGK